jgi:hypothetical protein
MTANFYERHDYASHSSGYAREPGDQEICKSPGVMDNLKRDRFELISAYLDGEVTAEERRQVEDWLQHDDQVQGLYQRLMALRHHMKAMPAPPCTQPTEQLAQDVIGRVHRQSQVSWIWGGAAVAALLLAVVSDWGALRPAAIAPVADQSEADQVIPVADGNFLEDSTVNSDALMIALDQPIFEIPKAPSSSLELVQPALYKPGADVQ